MFFSLIAELIIGIYGSEYFLLDVYSAVIVVGGTYVVEFAINAGELNELQIEVEELESRLSILCSRIEIVLNVLALVADLPNNGLAAEALTSTSQVLVTLFNSLTLVTDILGLISRGLFLLGVLAENNQLLAFNLTVLEVLSFVLRPVSLALRLFANLTSGVLLSGLATAGSTIPAVADLLTTTPGVDLLPVIFVGGILALFESLVGVIQSFVYYLLIEQYFDNVLNY